MKRQTLLQEVKQLQKIAGLLKEQPDIYDNAINYAYEMTPELMYEDGELSTAQSLVSAESEFKLLLRADRINEESTLAYRRYFENAWGHAQNHGATDRDDFMIWFRDVAVESPAYSNYNFMTDGFAPHDVAGLDENNKLKKK